MTRISVTARGISWTTGSSPPHTLADLRTTQTAHLSFPNAVRASTKGQFLGAGCQIYSADLRYCLVSGYASLSYHLESELWSPLAREEYLLEIESSVGCERTLLLTEDNIMDKTSLAYACLCTNLVDEQHGV